MQVTFIFTLKRKIYHCLSSLTSTILTSVDQTVLTWFEFVAYCIKPSTTPLPAGWFAAKMMTNDWIVLAVELLKLGFISSLVHHQPSRTKLTFNLLSIYFLETIFLFSYLPIYILIMHKCWSPPKHYRCRVHISIWYDRPPGGGNS